MSCKSNLHFDLGDKEWPKGSQWRRIIGIVFWSNILHKRKQKPNIIEPENGRCSASAVGGISYNIIYVHNIDIDIWCLYICLDSQNHRPCWWKALADQVASRTCSVMVLEAILIKSMESRKHRVFLSFPCFLDVLWISRFCWTWYAVNYMMLLSGCEMCVAIWSGSLAKLTSKVPLLEVILGKRIPSSDAQAFWLWSWCHLSRFNRISFDFLWCCKPFIVLILSLYTNGLDKRLLQIHIIDL